ncbi:MAG TPA: MFS transporter [Elusimicrobiota bacterium]|nr:MFS transporter [Elusimicrobiota bacterium]
MNSAPLASKTGGNWSFMLRALRYRNYRLFFGGQIVSLVGNWMTMTATSWLVFRLTGSAWMLGIVGFSGQLPSVVLTPLAGVVVDRVNQHRLLIATQVLSMLQSFALAALMFTGRMTIPALIALNVVQGLINAFDMPCRQSFVISMIENREDLSNAIALNSSMFNLARLAGPAIAGAVIAASGEGWCFLLDALSFLAVLVALVAMKVPARAARPKRREDARAELAEAWRYVAGSLPIRTLLVLLAALCLLGVPYGVLIPIFAGKILGGGPHTLGLLMTASGAGALLAALWLASLRSIARLSRAILVSTAGFGASLAGLGFSRSEWLSCAALFAAGFGFMLLMAASNTIIQTIVDEDKRGRVMSFLMMAILGTSPLGSLAVGVVADKIGAPATVIAEGAFCVVVAFWFSGKLDEFHSAVHPIYARMGLLPEAALADAPAPMTAPKR